MPVASASRVVRFAPVWRARIIRPDRRSGPEGPCRSHVTSRSTPSTARKKATIFLSGIQALVRLPLDQHRADRRRGPQHRHADLGLPRLAAGRARPHARAQPAAARASTTSSSSPASTRTSAPPSSTAASSPTTSRSRSTTACSACGTARARASTAPATSSSTPTSPAWAARRRAGAGRRRSALEVLDAAHALRGGASTTRSSRCCSRATSRRSWTWGGWASSCRATPGCGSASRSSPTSPTRSAPPRSAPGRVSDRRSRASTCEGRPWRHTQNPMLLPPYGARDGARDPLRAPGGGQGLRRRQRAQPRDARHRPTPGWASPPPARRTTTCARRSRELGLDDAALASPRHPAS